MLGAVCGDIIGSVYEKNNIKKKTFPLFNENDRFTDDTVMTCAILIASMEYKKNKNINKFRDNCIKYMRELGRRYINAGYGQTFIYWLLSKDPKPYNSYGNGSAMRVSSVAYVADSLEEAENLAKVSAEVTHSHVEGIKGAQAIAGSIWLLLHNANKREIYEYIELNYYKLSFKIDDIRLSYTFDVSCQGSVHQSIQAFLESNDFEDSIRIAVSLGGDSDTIAAITGSLAEAYYGIPKEIKDKAITYLDDELLYYLNTYYNFSDKIKDIHKKTK